VAYPFNQWDFVSILVWDDFVANPPVWEGCLQPVFQQYANLYPIMQRFVDLSSYESICQNIIPLKDSFSLSVDDPNSMPLTRDLSRAKRTAIVTWLTNLKDGKPLRSLPQTAPAGASIIATADTGAVAEPTQPTPDPTLGSKLAALQRVRLSNARHGLRRPNRNIL